MSNHDMTEIGYFILKSCFCSKTILYRILLIIKQIIDDFEVILEGIYNDTNIERKKNCKKYLK